MYKAVFILLLVLLLKPIGAQNLVPNPSFEDTIYCPVGFDEVNASKYWYRPTGASSDYFNTCSIGVADAPQNIFGYQNPRTGEGYVGVGFDFGPINPDYREYIAVELTEILKRGHVYELSFFVSRADSVTIAITNLGAVFSQTSLGGSFITPINAIPQIKSPDNLYLTDTQNWIEITGRFMARGGERFLTIGSFQDNNTIDTSKVPGSIFFVDKSYYYIDDVSLSDVSDEVFPNVFTPNGDGINDEFDLKIDCLDCGLKLQIYNRWGVLLNEDSTFKWNGKYHDVLCSNGVYYFVIVDSNSNTSIYSGFFHLQN